MDSELCWKEVLARQTSRRITVKPHLDTVRMERRGMEQLQTSAMHFLSCLDYFLSSDASQNHPARQDPGYFLATLKIHP